MPCDLPQSMPQSDPLARHGIQVIMVAPHPDTPPPPPPNHDKLPYPIPKSKYIIHISLHIQCPY